MADSFHATVETILVLLLIVFAVALIARWARLPYTIALVVTGLLGFQPGFRDLQLTPDLILTVFLPVLLFEGESLFNDGAAITLFSIVLAAIITGQFSIADGMLRFLVTVIGALAVGAVIGTAGSWLLRAVDNPQIQITTTVNAAYGSYLLAEQFGLSGAIAVVVSGLVFGNYGSTSGISVRSVYALATTWEFLGFVANSLIFLLIGIALDPRQLVAFGAPIAVAFLATLLGRAVAVYGLIPLLRGERKIPRAYRPVLVWGGLRGAVSLALVLSIPRTLPTGPAFPNRDLLQLMAFGVVGVSLLLQGLTMPLLIRRLGLVKPNASTDQVPILRARLHAVGDALLALTHERDQGHIGTLPYERLSQSYRGEQAQLEQQLNDLETTSAELPEVDSAETAPTCSR